MTIETREIDGVVVLDLRGKLTGDSGASTRLKDKVHSLVLEGHRDLVLNLLGVRYMDSGGLGELVRAHATLHRVGGSLRLLNLTGRIEDLLTITKLLTVFETIESEKEIVRGAAAA